MLVCLRLTRDRDQNLVQAVLCVATWGHAQTQTCIPSGIALGPALLDAVAQFVG